MIVIGEKINATRKSVKHALKEENLDFIRQLCGEQDSAGADYIDVNVGAGEDDVDFETRTMVWLVKALEEVTEKPLCIDSANPAVIEAGVKACTRAKPMINSVNGTDSRMDAIFPLASECGCPVIALAMNEEGIPATSEERVSICRQILERASSYEIPNENLLFDPLVLPLSTGEQQGTITLDTISLLKSSLDGVRTVVGLSNISFGLPRRSLINGAFLVLAIGRGADAAIFDPTNAKLLSQLRAAEVVAGRDRRCRRYTRAHNTGQLTD